MGTTANWRVTHQANATDDHRDALGKIICTFPLKRTAWVCWAPIVLAVVSLSASGLALVWSAVVLYNRYYRFGPALAEKEWPLPALFIGVTALTGILSTLRVNAIWDRKVILCENGLVVTDRRRSLVWLWQEITAFQSSVTRVYWVFIDTGTRRRYILHRMNGQRMVLDDSYEEVEQLADKIRQHIFPRLLDKALIDFHAGKRIGFGPVSIIKGGGLTINNRLIPWSQVLETRISEGSLLIKVKEGNRSKTISVAGQKILNPDVLITLLAMDLK